MPKFKKTNRWLIVICWGFVTMPVLAQTDARARVQFDEGQTYFEQGNYSMAYEKLIGAERTLGKWAPNISYLKIKCLNLLSEGNIKDDLYGADLVKEVNAYMKFYEQNESLIVRDKFQEISTLADVINHATKQEAFERDPLYRNGLNYLRKNNLDSSLFWFRKAADAGNWAAMLELGNIAYNNWVKNKLESSGKNAYQWYVLSSRAGSAKAMGMLSICYYYGCGTAVNYKEAFVWALEGAKMNDCNSTDLVGDHYYYGKGVAENDAEAFKWYLKASKIPNCNYPNWSLGDIYLVGRAGEKNLSKAITYFEKGVKSGNISCMTSLQNIYTDPKYGSVNLTKAAGYYSMALDFGHEDASKPGKTNGYYLLGDKYMNLKSYNDAIKAYETAAAKGNIEAMLKLADIYKKGDGVSKNKSLSDEWTRKAGKTPKEGIFKSIGNKIGL